MWSLFVDVNFWRAAVEIILISSVFYAIWYQFHSTRAAQIFMGLLLAFAVLILATYLLRLTTISWLLTRIITFGLLLSLVVIFQPELRTILAKLGAHPYLRMGFRQREEFIDQFINAIEQMASKRVGALVAIFQQHEHRGAIETGVFLDAVFSPELLTSLFYKGAPMHDGGVIIKQNRIHSAACVFPINNQRNLDRKMGLRHRAGIGISEEVSDAVVVVVSEETGHIMLVYEGQWHENLTRDQLSDLLKKCLKGTNYDDTKNSKEH